MKHLVATICFLLIAAEASRLFGVDFPRQLEEAQHQYHQLQFSASRSSYEQLLTQLPLQDDSLLPLRFEALLGLALVESASHNLSRAKILLRDAIRLAGWQTLDRTEYPPTFIQLYEQLKREEIKETGALAITTDPPFAEITVQGFKVGQSPLTLEFLPAGNYYIEAKLSGYLSTTESAQLPKGGQRIVSLALQRPQQGRETKFPQPLPTVKGDELLASLPPPPRENNHWYQTPWAWGGGLLLGAGVAIYFFARESKHGTVTIHLP